MYHFENTVTFEANETKFDMMNYGIAVMFSLYISVRSNNDAQSVYEKPSILLISTVRSIITVLHSYMYICGVL